MEDIKNDIFTNVIPKYMFRFSLDTCIVSRAIVNKNIGGQFRLFLKSCTRYLFQQPASSQERGSGLAVGRQGGPGSAGGPGAVDQARDLSPCLPASMGDAARPTTLPCSPPAAHHHGPHHTPLHQTHCGTNNNCYDGPTTPYDSRDYDSPGGWLFNGTRYIQIFFAIL